MTINELEHKLATIRRHKGNLQVKILSKALNAIEDVVFAFQIEEGITEHLVLVPQSEAKAIAEAAQPSHTAEVIDV